MGRWGPTGLGPKEAALLGAAAVGQGGGVWLARVALRVAVGLGPRDPLLLPPPRVVIGGVTDVVVDKRVGLLGARVDLVLAVASLGGQRIGVSVGPGDRSARSGLTGTEHSALNLCSAASEPRTVGVSAPSLPRGCNARLLTHLQSS